MSDKKIDNIVIENAKLIFRNFDGHAERFNPEGKRNFCVLIDPDSAEKLKADGWNIKTLRPRDDQDVPQPYLQVEVKFTNIPPKVWMITKTAKTLLDEDSISTLNYAEITTADVIITPYEWKVNGSSGVKAYLKSMYVTIAEDEFESKYFSKDEPDEVPFE